MIFVCFFNTRPWEKVKSLIQTVHDIYDESYLKKKNNSSHLSVLFQEHHTVPHYKMVISKPWTSMHIYFFFKKKKGQQIE